MYMFWKNKTKIVRIGSIAFVFLFLVGYSCYAYYDYVRYIPDTKIPDSTVYNRQDNVQEKDYFNFGDSICQEFVGDSGGISKIRFRVNMIDSNNNALRIQLIRKKDNIIVQEWNKGKKIKDGYITVKLRQPIKDSDKDIYQFVINATKEVTGTIYTSVGNGYLDGNFYYNGIVEDEDLIFEVIPCRADYGKVKLIFLILVLFMLLSAILVMVSMFLNKGVEMAFASFLLLFGCVYIFVLPPFSSLDEPRHYATAYQTSNVILGITKGGENLVTCRDCDHDSRLGCYPNLDSYQYVTYHLFKKTDKIENNSIYMLGHSIQGAPIVAHLPQALGITVARLLHLNYVTGIYFAQMGSLLFFALMVFWAIKIIPFGKYALLALSGLPMMMQQTVSCSYDIVIVGLAYLYIAYMLAIIYTEKPITIKRCGFILFLTVMLAPCKMVYCLLAFLVLLIPHQKFIKKIQEIFFKVAIPFFALLTAFVQNLSAVSESTGGTNYIGWADEEGFTLGYMLQHIPYMIKLFVATYHDKMGFYLESTVGSSLGWFDISIPFDLILISVIILILAIHSDINIRIRISHKILYISVFLCIALMICMTMLLGWTPLSYHSIEGVQGRYFLPIMPLLLICFMNRNRVYKGYGKIVVMGTVIVNYLVVLRIFETVIAR